MNILVVFTGGTIECSELGGFLCTDRTRSFLLIEMYKKLDAGVQFKTVQPYNILSENLTCKHLMNLYDCIKSCDSDLFDGIIVAHGTDTLQYTSSFLGYALSNFNKPVVLVSSNYPLTDKRANGFENFAAAVDFIKNKPEKGCFTAYKNGSEPVAIHCSTRLLPHMPYTDYIYSVSDSFYGMICGGKLVKNQKFTALKDEIKFDEIALDDEMRVLKITAHPDMSYPVIDCSVKAVLMEGYHSGTLPTASKELTRFCNDAAEKKVPVFLTGSTFGFNYESKANFDSLNITVLPKASPAAMYIKLKMLEKDKIFNALMPCGNDFVF